MKTIQQLLNAGFEIAQKTTFNQILTKNNIYYVFDENENYICKFRSSN